MSINVTHLARRLRVPTKELLEKLPELGFSLGKRAIKVNDREAADIQRAWGEMKRKESIQKKHKEQQEREERRMKRLEETKDNAIALPSLMTVRTFAELLDLPVTSVIQELMRAGVLANMNQNIDFETAAIVAGDMGFHVTNERDAVEAVEDKELDRIQQVLSEDKGIVRAPVVVVMGHVDHGKTRLLDAIRKTHIIETESGGITQHIGAYQAVRNGQEITFIDTPGHEAFTVMRSRGAKVADIAILVVAADDGVQPQTKEAIDIIKASKMPMIVAINKIDVAGSNIDKVKRELADLNLSPEEWGGSTIMVPISAKNEENIDALLDSLLLVYEVEKDNITANPERSAIGTIIESHVDKGAGPVATVLIQSGTLKSGDILGIHGENYGKVRAMQNYLGVRIKEAGPSVPVQILGWKVAPVVGDIMEVADAKDLAMTSKSRMKSASMDAVSAATVQRTESDDSSGGKKVLHVILKADVLGSIEAILGLFDKVKHDDVGIQVVHKALGNITEADIARAEGTNAVIIGFHVKVPGKVEVLAREKNVEVKNYDIIYKLFEEVVERLQGMLSDEVIVKEIGKLEVLAIFSKLDNGMVVGGNVTDGRLEVNSKLRVWRNGELIGEGDLADLRSAKESVKDVEEGSQCGIQYVGKTKIEVGDVIESYVEESLAKKLVVDGANS